MPILEEKYFQLGMTKTAEETEVYSHYIQTS